MIAELYGKISRIGSNLHERLEDNLTGDFFGNLRYIPFNKGIKPLLLNSVYPITTADCIESVDLDAWDNCVEFWHREREAEPDLLLQFDNVLIIIEVKLNSGLSSDDNVDNAGFDDDMQYQKSQQQLARESQLLARIASDKEKVLILLAPESSAQSIYETTRDRGLINNDIRFGYITWQRALITLKGLTADNPFERIIINDLIKLLERKGFDGFHGFNIPNELSVDELWTFEYSSQSGFSFNINLTVKEDEHYEFR